MPKAAEDSIIYGSQTCGSLLDSFHGVSPASFYVLLESPPSLNPYITSRIW